MENMMQLPNKDLIKKVITDYYKSHYGTNYDEDSFESSIVGAETIIKWLFENS